MKTKFFAVFMLAVLLLTACNGGTSPEQDLIDNRIPNEISASPTPIQTEQPGNTAYSVPSELSAMNLQGVSGKIRQIANGLDDNIVVFADEMHVYSLGDNSIKASANCPDVSDMKFIPLDDGYALIAYGTAENSAEATNTNETLKASGMASSQSAGYHCYLYDAHLNITDTVFLGDEINGAGAIAVSSDGNKIAYSSYFEASTKLLLSSHS